MAPLIVVASFLLAIVFVVSAVGKLMDRAGSRTAMRDFGVPAVLAPAVALLLPVTELAVAGLLLLPDTARWGAIGAVALLVVFVAGIAVNMAQGRHPDCHCFGQIHSEPAGWSTIGRNLLLLIPALLIVFGESLERGFGARVEAGIASFRDAEPAARVGSVWLLVLLAGALAYAMVITREDRRLEARLDGLIGALDARDTSEGAPVGYGQREEAVPRELPVGAVAPWFELPDLNGTLVSLGTLLSSGKTMMLVFADPGCGPCGQLLRELPTWRETLAGTLEIVVISRGDVMTNRAKPGMSEMRWVLLQRDRELALAYGIMGTPSAVLVRADGTIGSPVTGGLEPVRAMLATGGVGTPVS